MIFGQVMGQNSTQNSKCSIFGHTFFDHNSAIFCPIGLKIVLVTQVTIIYRLVRRNRDLGAFLKNPIFSGKMGVAATLEPKDLGP